MNFKMPTWIFGYGSLIWKVDFNWEENCFGYIEGFQRVFYQNSTTYRGTPENPGRVVTLIPTKDKSDRVYGVAYKIPDNDVDSVIRKLDQRESRYRREIIDFKLYPESQKNNLKTFKIIVYLATSTNPNYVNKNNSIEEIAHQIFNSKGRGGENKEYVYLLADFMRNSFPGIDDSHLYAIEEILRKMDIQNNYS